MPHPANLPTFLIRLQERKHNNENTSSLYKVRWGGENKLSTFQKDHILCFMINKGHLADSTKTTWRYIKQLAYRKSTPSQ